MSTDTDDTTVDEDVPIDKQGPFGEGVVRVEIDEDTHQWLREAYEIAVEQGYTEQEAVEIQERNIIRLLLNYGHQSFVPVEENQTDDDEENQINVAEAIVNDLTDDDIQFVYPVYQKIFDLYKNFVDEEEIKSNKTITHHEDKEIADTAINLLAEPFELSKNWSKKHKIHIQKESDIIEKTVVHSLLAFKLDKLKQQKQTIQESLKDIDDKTDNAEILKRMDQINKLNKKVQKIAESLGRIVLR